MYHRPDIRRCNQTPRGKVAPRFIAWELLPFSFSLKPLVDWGFQRANADLRCRYRVLVEKARGGRP